MDHVICYFCLCTHKYFLLDYTKGFGGKFGIQTDRVDKSAVGFDHFEKVSKHESQRGWSD